MSATSRLIEYLAQCRREGVECWFRVGYGTGYGAGVITELRRRGYKVTKVRDRYLLEAP